MVVFATDRTNLQLNALDVIDNRSGNEVSTGSDSDLVTAVAYPIFHRKFASHAIADPVASLPILTSFHFDALSDSMTLSNNKLAADANPQTSVAKTSPTDYLALAISTWGVGYLPLAPGTWGSLVGVLIFLLIGRLSDVRTTFLLASLVVIVLVTLAGIWAASQVERLMQRKDPGRVVVDEVAGQLISLLPLAWVGGAFSGWVIVSFILFRFFDIVKPYPARRFEALRGGLGIMADDLVAGVYGALITAILTKLFH